MQQYIETYLKSINNNITDYIQKQLMAFVTIKKKVKKINCANIRQYV